jgi:hypothetical protein
MNWLEKQTDKGVLKYRMPNIIEAYEILEISGAGNNSSVLSMKKKIIENMAQFLDFKDIGAESYNDVLNMVDEMIIPLSEIADEILLRAFSAFKKKSF